jgi:hypothetical protein
LIKSIKDEYPNGLAHTTVEEQQKKYLPLYTMARIELNNIRMERMENPSLFL